VKERLGGHGPCGASKVDDTKPSSIDQFAVFDDADGETGDLLLSDDRLEEWPHAPIVLSGIVSGLGEPRPWFRARERSGSKQARDVQQE
jgi:hypothetical protein